MLSNTLVSEVFQTVMISEALYKKCFLVRSDLTGGMRDPFGGPRRSASRTDWVRVKCLTNVFLVSTHFGRQYNSLGELHTWEAWLGARACRKAAKGLLFLPSGGQDLSMTYGQVMRVKESVSYTSKGSTALAVANLSRCVGGGGREGRSDGHHSSDL